MDAGRSLSNEHLFSLFILIASAGVVQAQECGMAEGWVARYDGPGDGPDWPEDVISTGAGTACVTGSCGYESMG